MFLKKISLVNFKNYEQLDLSLSSYVNCFVGNNGMGKTNVLDAIYYLSNCKSFFNSIDSQNILHEQDFFVIQGEFDSTKKTEKIYCGVKKGKKKVFKKGKKEYEKLSEHIGLINTVLISPMDINLIYEGSEVRRKFVDLIISQYNTEYLQTLIKYNKVLLQRNALLKSFIEKRNFNALSLEVWDEQLIEHGNKIHQFRKDFIAEFTPIFNEIYQFISNKKEIVSFGYKSQLLEGTFKENLANGLQKDSYSGHTSMGIHKDDYLFQLNGKSLKKLGSQGQQKTFLISLKLAHFKHIESKTNSKPILLLDDIYDKLDEERIGQLMTKICEGDYGQVFITDTNTKRLPAFFKKKKYECFAFEIENGTIID